MRIRPVRLAVATVVGVVALAACSSTETPTTPAASSSGTSPAASTAPAAFPVTIENLLGDAVVTAQPTRVVAVGSSELDTVLALGTVPVAYGTFGDAAPYPYQSAAIDGAPIEAFDLTDGVPVEKIASYRPDLIVNMSWGNESDYTKLSAIAPVVSWVTGPFADDWQTQVSQIAPALGQAAEGDTLTSEMTEQLARQAEQNPTLAGKTVTYATPGADGAICVVDLPTAPAILLLSELDLVPNPAFSDPASAYCREVSPENFSDLDADLLVMVAGPSEQAALEKVRPFANLPVVSGGHTVWLDSALEQANALNSPTLLSLPVVIDDVVPQLVTAVG